MTPRESPSLGVRLPCLKQVETGRGPLSFTEVAHMEPLALVGRQSLDERAMVPLFISEGFRVNFG